MSEDKPTTEKGWEDKVKDEAISFAMATQQNFDHWMQKSLKLLPLDSPDTRLRQLDLFVDALAGSTVEITCRYINPDMAVEEALVKTIRDKFKLYRQLAIMAVGREKPRLIQ